MLSNSIFGGVGKTLNSMEITSYKRDAANLLANRIQKKFREVFEILKEFSAF